MNLKKIIITGATGFIGKKLTLELFKKGYDIHVLTRNTKAAQKSLKYPIHFHHWDGETDLDPAILENTEAIIHLAGEPIAQRWNEKVKAKIYSSRINSTKTLIENISKLKNKPKAIIGTSAIGFYGDRGEEELNESSSSSDTYLARVCRDWEDSYESSTSRSVLIRVGIVLGLNGGALEEMLPPFRMGVGGKLAHGKQWMSWIHLDDLVQMYLFALENEQVHGIINGVAPNPVTNQNFTQTLSQLLNRPALFPVPKLALKILFGEMSVVLLSSQKVFPKNILNFGFKFKYQTLNEALTEIINPLNYHGAYVHEVFQWIPKNKDETFAFFSEARNLEKITPPWLHFNIRDISTSEIQKGTLIRYRLRVKGIPVFWKTLIKEWTPNESFVDFQLKGPYSIWHHTHTFHELKGGILMTDRVVYKIPLGFIGDLAQLLMVKKDVTKIFEYRSDTIIELFKSGKI